MKTRHGFHVSKGNMKLGNIWNFSTLPGKTCAPGVPCTLGCYAMKALRLYPQARLAWTENTDLLTAGHWAEFIEDLVDLINNAKGGPMPYFRFSQAGDIFSQEYWGAVCDIARQCKNTNFWAYTKQYGQLEEYIKDHKIPRNLCVILSVWHDFRPSEELAKKFPQAFYDDSTEEIPEGAFKCPGSCKDCKYCATMNTKNIVVFHKH